jgi:hypothetical protein
LPSGGCSQRAQLHILGLQVGLKDCLPGT